MKKINVCHVVSGLKSGGAETMIYNYTSKMNRNEYNFYLLYQHDPVEKCVNEFNDLNFKLKRIPSKVKHPIRNYKETKRFLIENKIDVIHCHMTLANFIPLMAAKRAKVNLRICHSHEAGTSSKNFIASILNDVYKRICLLCANKYVACGKEAGKFLYRGEEFIVLNNALDLEKFRYKEDVRSEIRKKLSIEKDSIVIGHIGRFIDVKNHQFIVEIFKELLSINNKFKLLLIGSGELENQIRELVKKLNIEDNVIFTGVISNTYDYYNAFDIFVLPSQREGLPLVALESQANGLKCYLSKNIDTNSCVIDSCKMLPLEKKIWINEIIKTNGNYVRDIIFDSFDKRNLNIKREVQKLDDIYKEVINYE